MRSLFQRRANEGPGDRAQVGRCGMGVGGGGGTEVGEGSVMVGEEVSVGLVGVKVGVGLTFGRVGVAVAFPGSLAGFSTTEVGVGVFPAPPLATQSIPANTAITTTTNPTSTGVDK